uniref:Nucleoporin NUP35 n=1 Tax=Lygus hesperus TaxID=30085 RepID=A0A0A9WMN9_LYGHE
MNNENSEDGFFPEHLLGALKESIQDTLSKNRRCPSNLRDICGGCCNEIPFRGLSDESFVCETECGSSEPESNQRSGKRILVYGFQEKLLPLIETLFCQIGHITSYEVSHIGTWIAICYEQEQDANRAIARHLTVVQGTVIGVTDKPAVIRQAMAANRKLRSSINRTAHPIRRLGALRTESVSRCHPPRRFTGWEKLLENLSNF